MYIMTKLAIVVPTRGRPHNIKRLADALEKTCTTDYQLFIRIDEDDKSYYPLPILHNATWTSGPRVFFAASTNETVELALQENDFTHIAVLGDDVLPETVGWDKMMIDALPELGVAYGSDGLEHLHGQDLPTHIVVPVEMYRRLGWIALPTLRHLFCDNVWRELGKLTSFIYVPEAKLTHLHRWNKKAPNDTTYEEANDKKKREQDREAFESWRDGNGMIEAKAALFQEVR
jgi:hypothetical protein